MPRCDYDVVFYRVFCVTLLGIGFTFTVILTNVFIDIDGLLANKQGKQKTVVEPPIESILDEFIPEPPNTDDTNYGDFEDSYRTKRSIESQKLLFHVKNPKLKNILTNRLETLLEALETEESLQTAKTDESKTEATEEPQTETPVAEENKFQEEKIKKQKDEEVLHLTMHNILLQGIIGHMDMNEVYKRVNSMMNNLNKGRKDQKVNENPEEKEIKSHSEEAKLTSKLSLSDKFVQELVRGNDLQDQLLNSAFKKVTNGPEEINTPSSVEPEKTEHTGADIAINTKLGPKLFIKTTIDIKSIANESNDTISNENIHGIINLIYNGKSVKFTKPDADQRTNPQKYIALDMSQLKPITANVNKIPMETTSQVIPVDFDILKEIPSNYVNKFVAEYFKHFPTENRESTEVIKERIETKRLKRHVKIKFNNNKEKKGAQFFKQAKPPVKKDTDDDELYVEIETHFDSKGMKGEKKKKLIRSLIDKIQKAIRSEETKKKDHESKKIIKQKPLHVRKRLQNPLEHVNLVLESKNIVPVSSIVHRQLNPIIIPRTFPSDDTSAPKVRDRSGEAWRKEFVGPTFLTATKSINSAEMSEVEVDYNRVLDVNGIPQRLQKPLNTDTKDVKEKPNSYFDLGNMKFFIKDVDGSGFSIGFNQYVDEPPDPETIKLFTGLENVIQTYHQNVDQIQEDPQDENFDIRDEPEVIPMKNDHIIVRRSVNHKHDYHTNEYKIIYDGNFLPYNDYKDIYAREDRKKNKGYRSNQFQLSPLIVDEHIFDKNLKPAEIFGLANLFRKRRSIKVKKISNLRSKMKLNRYINTKTMSTKRIFLNKKGRRHKRQISKIRIIASDSPYKQSNDAELFLVSGENIFADRALVKDVEGAEMEGEKIDISDYTPDQTEENMSPYRIFESKSRNNNLMSKYPHVFMEEISRSKEDLSPRSNLLFGQLPTYRRQNFPIEDAESVIVDEDFLGDTSSTLVPELYATTEKPEKIQGVEEIVQALQSPKSKYKVTLKVTPKNASSDTNQGFKEIHTSINKRYNKNGLVYTSLVNVSEISKITNPNKTKEEKGEKQPKEVVRANYLTKKVKDQHDRMQAILKSHQKHIDEQLAKLGEEKTNIESMLIDENNKDMPHTDYIDVVMPSKPNKVLHISKDEVKKMTEILLNNSITTSTEATTVKTTTISTTTAAPTTQITTTQTETPPTNAITQRPITVATTHLPPSFIFNEYVKKNLLHTIERNEKLTDQILRKIDKNTEILQVFLRKFTGGMEPYKTERKFNIPQEITTAKAIPKFDHNINHPFPIDWRQHANIPYNPNMIQRNGSQIAIPFLYAYQHPIMPLKMNSPIASVVYHGTIHTNSVQAKDLSSEKHKFLAMPKMPYGMNPSRNQSRFFLDEAESDYKVIPVGGIDKHQMHKNMTKT